MSAPSVSLFPDDADSTKTYLAVTQTSLYNLWIWIYRRICISKRNRFSYCLMGPKEQFDEKNRDQNFSRYCPFKREHVSGAWLSPYCGSGAGLGLANIAPALLQMAYWSSSMLKQTKVNFNILSNRIYRTTVQAAYSTPEQSRPSSRRITGERNSTLEKRWDEYWDNFWEKGDMSSS